MVKSMRYIALKNIISGESNNSREVFIMEGYKKIRERLKWKNIIITIVLIGIAIGTCCVYVTYRNRQAEENKYYEKIIWFDFEECDDMRKDRNQFNICKECNADIIEKIEEWNQKGLRSFLDWDETAYTVLRKKIEEDDYWNVQKEGKTEKENVLLLLNGGGDILNMDFNDFERAITYIETIGIWVDEQMVWGTLEKRWWDFVRKEV